MEGGAALEEPGRLDVSEHIPSPLVGREPRRRAMRVLVIEDDRETAQFLQKSLKESGHSADTAADGETGLAMAQGGAYDILIVDRMLPRLDGLSVVKTLRSEG